MIDQTVKKSPKKVLVVINPRSGSGAYQHLENALKFQAELSPFDFQLYIIPKTTAYQDIKKLIKSYRPTIVAAAGGDGTVNLMAGILAHTNIPLLIIPLGSANGMAKELGIGNSLENTLSLISAGVIKPIDLIEINNRICVHLADFGLNARIVKSFEEDVNRGMLTYARHLFRQVFMLKSYRITLSIDGKQLKRKVVSLTFANASKYGTGAVINPQGLLDDGKFELVLVKPFPRIKLLSIAWKMFTNTLQTSDFVEIISVKNAEIKISRKTTFQIDGEITGKVKEIKAKILPKALSVLVPPVSLT
ncbi:MAG: diacylglycerol kinase family protein [Daejeonella sp.]